MYLAEPLTVIFNCGLRKGEYPEVYKEICTPVPKVTSPQNTSQLRNICGLPLFDHVYESLLAQQMVSDMEAKLDPGQFGNQKGISIQHYLVKMLHRILGALDK